MSWLGDVVGSLAGSVFGSAVQDHYNSANAAQANEWNVENYKHRYQWAMQDMEQAGLNPILAATNGIGGSISGASAASVGMSNPADSFASMGHSSAAKRQAQIAENLSYSQIGKNQAEADLLTNKNNGQVIENGILANDLNLKEQLYEKELKFREDRMNAEIELLRNQGYMYATGALSNIAGAMRANSAAAFDREQTRLSKQEADFYDDMGGSNSALGHGLRALSLLLK